MAQTRKRRRRKHRGTQGGSIDRRTTRPRSRSEARARVRSRGGSKKSGPRQQGPPTWRGAINRGLAAAGIFFLLMALLFKRPLAQAISLSIFMLAFYIPVGYFIDNIMYRRREAKRQREREARKAG